MAEISVSMLPIARRYASALLSLSLEVKAVSAIEKQLITISNLLKKSKEFNLFIVNPIIPFSEKLAVIDSFTEKIFGTINETTSLVSNLLYILAMNGRLYLLPAILNDFRDLWAKKQGLVTVFIVSTRPLTNKILIALKRILSLSLGKKIFLQVSIDSSLLGGLIVRIGSRQIDGSLRTQLSLLMHALKEVG